MTRSVLSIVIIAFVACSKASPQQHGVTGRATGNACDRKLLTPADVGDLLGAPIAGMQPLPGDPQSCLLKTASVGSLTVSLRPSVGNVTVQTWLDGKMPLPATPLAGVGDKAAWVSELTEVVATKADLLCDIQTDGAVGPRPVVKAKVSSLCNIIFGRSL